MIGRLILILAMSASVAGASMPLLNVPYQVTAVDALTNGQFRLQGWVHDGSQLGYGAPDVATNDYLINHAQTTGDIDLYRITEIWSQADSWMVCDVIYVESGTPRAGQPEAGYQEISRSGYLYSTTFGGPSEYLQNGARNLFYHMLDGRVTGVETGKLDKFSATAEQVLTNGATIAYYGNALVSTANATITLGNPQIQTNGVSEGSLMFLRGAAVTGGIMVTNGSGVALDCRQSFLIGTNDLMSFFFTGGAWVETRRIDRKQ
ncbi:MAG: hypothetical protein WC130_04440 [Kiritimatiellia bacterium]